MDQHGPFESHVVAAIVGHMNLDHAADCRAIYAHRAGGVTPPDLEVVLAGYDEAGAWLHPVGDEAAGIVVPWSAPLRTRADVRDEFIAMVEAARR